MRKNKKLFLTAAVSAALLFGGYEVSNAYTYSGATTTVDKVAEDTNDLVITGKSNITGTSSQNPQKVKSVTETIAAHTENQEVVRVYPQYHATDIAQWEVKNLPINPTDTEIKEITNRVWKTCSKTFGVGQLITLESWGSYGDVEWTYFAGSEESQKKYGIALNYSKDKGWFGTGDITKLSVPSRHGNDVYDFGGWNTTKSTKQVEIPEKEVTTLKKIGAAAITVSNESTLTGQADIISGVSTAVTENSSLTAKGNFTTPTLTVADSNVTVGGNATVASGGLKTTGSSKVDVSNGTLTVGNGAVNIAKGGILKAKVLKAAATGTETSVIGSSTNIQGTLTVAGQVKGVTAGTATTDAVNKGQLDSAVSTLTTKISQGGKTYTAGSDIDISSANAISVKKAGLITS